MPRSLTLTASVSDGSLQTGSIEGLPQHCAYPIGLKPHHLLALQGCVPSKSISAHEEVCCHGVQDLELDIPDAAHFVALFLGRATVDEVLPPAFLTAVLQRMHDDSLGVQVVRSVGESAQPLSPQLILVSGLRHSVSGAKRAHRFLFLV